MSFGDRLRVKRRSPALLVAALVGSVGMTTTVAPPVPAPTQSTSQAPREFVHVEPAKRRAPATVVNRAKPKGKGWDTRKGRRRLLMQLAGRENTGRQWVRLHRALRRGNAPQLLAMEAWKLREVYESGFRIVLSKAAVA